MRETIETIKGIVPRLEPGSPDILEALCLIQMLQTYQLPTYGHASIKDDSDLRARCQRVADEFISRYQ